MSYLQQRHPIFKMRLMRSSCLSANERNFILVSSTHFRTSEVMSGLTRFYNRRGCKMTRKLTIPITIQLSQNSAIYGTADLDTSEILVYTTGDVRELERAIHSGIIDRLVIKPVLIPSIPTTPSSPPPYTSDESRSTSLEYRDCAEVIDRRGQSWRYCEPSDTWGFVNEDGSIAQYSFRSFQRLSHEFGPVVAKPM